MTFQKYHQILKSLDNGIIVEIFKLVKGFEDNVFTDGTYEQRHEAISTEFLNEVGAVSVAGTDLLYEIETNSMESTDKTLITCLNIVVTLENRIKELIDLLNLIDKNRTVKTITEEYAIKRFFEITENFIHPKKVRKKDNAVPVQFLDLIYILTYTLIKVRDGVIDADMKLRKPQSFEDSAVKILYLHFSGILDEVRDKIETSLGKRITAKRLAESVAFLTNERAGNIEVLLSSLTHIKQGKIHKAFTKAMIEKANSQLDIDGFDVPELSKLLLKMDQTN